MTLTDYANFINSKLGQLDDNSLALCKGFVQARFRMIWDSELWRDTQLVIGASSPFFAANSGSVPFPTGIERIISIRCAGTFLDPVDSTFIVETNPTLLDTTGAPLFYEDYTDPTDGTRKLRLFPAPTTGAPAALVIVGKRPCPTLADGDTPGLRNVDNALLAFAMGDMLERQRQYAKAQAKFQEAATQLALMQKIESDQADRQRQNKTLSANADTLGDYIDEIASKIHGFDPATRIRIKQAVRRQYQMVWDAYLWRETLAQTSATTSAGVVTLPGEIERPISVRIAGAAASIEALDITTVYDVDPTLFEASGTPAGFTEQRQLDGTLQVVVRPMPADGTVVGILGKRKLVPLNAETDAPLLRNVANTLILSATADMLAMTPNATSAPGNAFSATPNATLTLMADLKQAAAAALAAMKALQDEQSMRRRQSRTLSATANTLLDITNAVLARCSAWDIESVILAKEFVRREYEMVWNSFLWRETIAQATATISAGGVVALPAAIERPISVRYGTTALLATEQEILFDVEPSTFDQTGVPTSFTDQRASDGTLQVLLNPPVDSGSVVILGKRTLVPLVNDADVPLLRNVGPALIGLASADMLARTGGDAGIASALKAEGVAAVETMKSLQSDQTMRARRSRSLTVAGNSLAELTDAVCARCGAWDLESLIMVREFLRRQYQAMWDSRPWKESNVLARVATDGQTVILPDYMERVITVLTDNNYALLPRDLTYLFAVNPLDFTRTGQPIGFSILTSSATRILPAGEALNIVSADDTDKGLLMVRGEAGGLEYNETVGLNGTTPVTTMAQNYNMVLTLAKPITVGTVTVTGATTGTTLLTLLPVERERKHIRLWLRPASPNCGMEYLVLAKRRIQPLVNDSDTPLLRQCQDALIHAAAGDMFTQMGKADMATDARAQAAAALATMVDLETDQGANLTQIVPYVEPSYTFSGYDTGYGGADGWLRW